MRAAAGLSTLTSEHRHAGAAAKARRRSPTVISAPHPTVRTITARFASQGVGAVWCAAQAAGGAGLRPGHRRA